MFARLRSAILRIGYDRETIGTVGALPDCTLCGFVRGRHSEAGWAKHDQHQNDPKGGTSGHVERVTLPESEGRGIRQWTDWTPGFQKFRVSIQTIFAADYAD
jgi:hypothetical protein